jgi:hypothetical protein
VSHALAVVDRHPVSNILLFLPLFLAHGPGVLSRRISGEPFEPATVRRREVAESEPAESSMSRSHRIRAL